ncbi:MAG: hypothetical protein ACYC36_02420 [Bellilinea sp.]
MADVNNMSDQLDESTIGSSQISTRDKLRSMLKINPEQLKGLGAILATKFAAYERDRKLAELQWARNARQFLGQYDQEIEKNLDPNRSRAYPKYTRVKCVSMLSRLMNLLFQADDKCWTIQPSPVPELDQEDLQGVLDKLLDDAQGGPTPTDDQIEQAIRDFAANHAKKLELEIEDQLQELGGSSSEDFVQLCRQVIFSGVRYGMGVLKGPFAEKQQQRTWTKDESGRLMAVPVDSYRPRFEFVPLWDYYPDMSARYLKSMEGQFERHVMSKHQLTMLKQRPDFIPEQIDEVMRLNPNGNYTRKAWELEVRAMGVQLQVTDVDRNKFEALGWEGYLSGRDLSLAGIDVPDDKMEEDLRCNVWFAPGGNVVIKAELDPWSELDTDGEMPLYHQFVFEENESTLVGTGLPQIMRDSQMNICAGTRVLIDNASIQRIFEMNTGLLSLNQDTTSITPDKIFYREDTSAATANIPAVREVKLDIRVSELTEFVKLFQNFADQETFVNPSTGGDMQKGPSEPFRTAAGASMIQGAAALPFKDVVRNFDKFTESVISSIVVFNRNFNPDPKLRGDFKPVARGATSLMAKEVLGIQLDNFANTLTPEEKQYVKMRELVKARARVRDLEVTNIIVDDATADAIDKAAAQRQQIVQQQQDKLAEAQVRNILAETLKAASVSGKNTAQADAQTVNVILDALEKGIPLDSVLKSISSGQAAKGALPDMPDQAQQTAAPEQAQPAAMPASPTAQ